VKAVVDASLSLKWQLRDEPDLEPADRLLLNAVNGRSDLVAPDLWLYEVVNGLRTAVARGHLSKEKGGVAIDDFIALGIALYPSPSLAVRASQLANDVGLAIYDSAYLSLAEHGSADRYTADRPPFERTKGNLSFVKWFAEYHS
jgi:predicted nucleic acid-binding protein